MKVNPPKIKTRSTSNNLLRPHFSIFGNYINYIKTCMVFIIHSYRLTQSCTVFSQHVEAEYKTKFETNKYINISLMFACIKASLRICGCVEIQCKVYADYN